MRMISYSIAGMALFFLVASQAAAQGIVQYVPDVPLTVSQEAYQASPSDFLAEPGNAGSEMKEEAWQRDVGIGWKDDRHTSACEPLWNVYVGAAGLKRSSPNGVPSVNYDWELGVDVDVRRRLGDKYQLQARYFGVDKWSDGPVEWSDAIGPTLFTSNLHSTEVNLRRQRTDKLTLMGGFRWVEMSDFASDGDAFLDTNNHMYGGQLGAEWLAWDRGGPFTMTTGVKAGIYFNRADYDSLIQGGAAASRTNHTAFLGEWDIMARYRLTDRWTLRTGYQLLWLEGVASADSNQWNAAQNADPVSTSGSPFYHGITLGAEFHW